MKKSTIVATLVCALFVPAAASAADSPQARAKAAKKACAAGDFRKGVEILADLYVDTDDVTYIYNQGRCYEQNHQWVSAIDRFREYLLKRPDASADERAETERHIAACEAFRLKEQEDSKPAAAGVLVSPPPAAVVPTPPPATPANEVTERPAAPSRAPGAALRVTGVVLGALGIAAAGTGLVLNLKANSLAKDYNENPSSSLRSSQSTYKTSSTVCYAAGAGALVAGIVVYLIGHRSRGESPPQVSLLSVVTSTEFSLSLRKVF